MPLRRLTEEERIHRNERMAENSANQKRAMDRAQRDEHILKLNEKGFHCNYIAHKFGLSGGRVSAILKKNNVAAAHVGGSTDRLVGVYLERSKRAKKMREKGMTYREIGDKLGCTRQAAWMICQYDTERKKGE